MVNLIYFLVSESVSLADLSGKIDFETSHPSSSSALQSYILCLPYTLHRYPQTALTILLCLVDLESLLVEKEHENVLFEEDPLNNYMEEISVLRTACKALEVVVAAHYGDLKEILRLSQQVKNMATVVIARLEISTDSDIFSPWDEPNVFHGVCKVSLVSEALVNGVQKSGSSQELIEPLKPYVNLYFAL